MNWLALVGSIIALLDALTRSFETRRLIRAGEAQAASEALRTAHDRILEAQRARRAARDLFDRDRLHDDGYRRD